MTAKEVAEVLGISLRRVQVLAKEGRLPVARVIGQASIFRRRDVEAFASLPRRPGRPSQSPKSS